MELNLILTGLTVLFLNLFMVEAYFFLVRRVPDSSRIATIALVWISFILLFFLMVFTAKVSLDFFSDEIGQKERLIAQAPILIASLYLLIFKRKQIEAMRKRFQR